MRELKLSYGSWFLNILFLANVLLLSFVQPLYSQEVELKKAADLGEQGEKLFDQGRFTEALPIIEKAVSIYEKVLGPEHPDVATNLGNLALIYYRLGNFSKAEEFGKRALAIREKALGPEHPDVAVILHGLAMLYDHIGDSAKAETLHKRALAINDKAFGSDPSAMASRWNNLAELYSAMGENIKSELLYKQAYDVKLLGRAQELYMQHRYDESVSIVENVLSFYEKSLGTKSPIVGFVLNVLARNYLALLNYTKAEPLYKRSLSIYEKAFGPEHPKVAIGLNNLAMLYFKNGNYTKAEALFKRSLAIREKVFGPDHPDVAQSLNNLGWLYTILRDYSKAELLLRRSIAINEKVLGPEHPDVAQGLNNLAELYHELGNYYKAEPLYKRALVINEENRGPGDEKMAEQLNDLAEFYREIGEFSKAEPLYKRALMINEKLFGPDHPDVATNLNNLGLLHISISEYSKAETLFKRALEIRKKIFGPEHPDVATSLNELANLYYSLGDYSKAEPLYKRSLAIYEKTFGPEHPNVAMSLNNLAELYSDLGDYSKAELLYKKALAMNEKLLGPHHPDVALVLHNMADLYNTLGDYSKAEPLYKRSLAIYEKTFGPEHPNVAMSLNNLAELYSDLGDYAKAESLLKRALATNEKLFGPDHPEVIAQLNNLAVLYLHIGNYSKAESQLKRGLSIYEKTLGFEHLGGKAILNNSAAFYSIRGNFNKARDFFKLSQEIDNKLIDQVMGFTAEAQKIKFLSTKKSDLYAFLSLINQHLNQNSSAKVDALNIWFKRKGAILEAQKRFQEAIIYSDNHQAVETFQKLAKIRAQLSKLAFTGPGKGGLKIYKKKISDLESHKERLEVKLSHLSQAYALKKKIVNADCEKVAGILQAKTVLLEFAKVKIFHFKTKSESSKWKPAHYLAFILHAGKGDKVGLVDLGNAEKIDKEVAKLKKEISLMDEKSVSSSKKIYDLVFKPLIEDLGNVKEIFISPDGNLNLIPFEVLQGPDGKYLIEDYTFNYLSAGRDVLGFGQSKEKGRKALLIGDPNFDLDPEKKKPYLQKLALLDRNQEKLPRRSADLRGFHYKRLPGARKEVKAIEKIMGDTIKTEIFLGSEALEEVLKRKGSQRILHLATHGFFLNDQELSNMPVYPMARGFDTFSFMPVKQKGIKARIENPMLRSGFVLAGANKSLLFKDKQMDDGIVTAEEILGLRLRGTDMVVLSACDTGLGDVKTGEGVFGLRRAFDQAGAKSLIMSLWAVPDKETRELMVEFYKNVIKRKMNRCQALRQAALKEMKLVKKRYGHAYPLCWGGFVMVGDPGKP